MTPTPEQVTAALRYLEEREFNHTLATMHSCELVKNEKSYPRKAGLILAAAYRELLAENERLNSRIEDFELEGQEYAEAHDID